MMPGCTTNIGSAFAPPGRVHIAVQRALEAVAWREVLDASEQILVKPNLGYDFVRPGTTTSPVVIKAVVELLVAHGHLVTIIEGDQVLVDVETAARQAGIPSLCEHPRVSWVNLSRTRFVRREFSGARVFQEIGLPEILDSAPLLTLPVMKTHAKCVVSGAIKNQWGVLPIDRHHYHSVLDDALVDLHDVVRPSLCLMDATVCLEGNGPKSGRARHVDHVFAARDPFLLDWFAAKLMGFDPSEIAYLEAIRRHRGDVGLPPVVIGPVPDLARFMPAEHNLVSLVESRLRQSRIAPLVFDSPVFKLCCRGARLWYQLGHLAEPLARSVPGRARRD